MPAFALVHEKKHPGGPGVRFPFNLPFLLEIGQHLMIHGTSETVKGINAFCRLDHSSPSPNTLIIDH
jgi:hypothetical protein